MKKSFNKCALKCTSKSQENRVVSSLIWLEMNSNVLIILRSVCQKYFFPNKQISKVNFLIFKQEQHQNKGGKP